MARLRDHPGQISQNLIRQRGIRPYQTTIGPGQRHHQPALTADRQPSGQLPLEQHPRDRLDRHLLAPVRPTVG
jgi:hypothetical protein